MNTVREWLKGKKTYIVCGAAVLAAVLAWSQDQLTTFQLIEAILAAVGGITLSARITRVANGKE